jgi:hypothetical protein
MNYDIIIIGPALQALQQAQNYQSREKRSCYLLSSMIFTPSGGYQRSMCHHIHLTQKLPADRPLKWVGLHEMDGPGPRDLKVKIFRDLGLTDKVTLLDVPEFYRFVNERYDVVIPMIPKKLRPDLPRSFPVTKKG